MIDQATFTVDEKTYTIAFDCNVLAEVEEETRCNLLYATLHMDVLTMTSYRALLLALLRPHHPKMTLAETGALLRHASDRAVIARAVAEVLTDEALDDKPGEKKGDVGGEGNTAASAE